jgi:hypothetical protein
MNKLNRSAYWIPSMLTTLNGVQKVMRPDIITVYYKRRPSTDPQCLVESTKGCVGIPRGLRMVFGYNMKSFPTPVPEMINHDLESTTRYSESGFGWRCYTATSSSLSYRSLANLLAANGCPLGTKLEVSISAPPCWDGNLDSADHRSHVAHGAYGSWGYWRCPSTHPYILPQFSLKFTFNHNGPQELATWYLSSDRMNGISAPAGSTFHSDWFGAWDDTILKTWEDNAINKMLNCSAGDLGNGYQLKQFNSTAGNQKLVDLPVRPISTMSTNTSVSTNTKLNTSFICQ